MTVKMKDYVFHRDMNKTYPIITHGEGVYLYDQSGRRYIDASSGAVAANLGHSNPTIGEAMANQAKNVGFAHTMRFETEVLHQLAEKIALAAPKSLNRVYFTSGGSEANESAIKLARQYHRDRGKSDKHIVIGRWQSYHGNTLGSLAAGGDIKRRHPYAPILSGAEHVYSPFCLHCPYQRNREDCMENKNWSCVSDIERKILELGPENVSSIIMEPIVGSQQGAVLPPEGYFQQIRELCNQHDVILIVDEVLTGFGRTGTYFAIEHFGIEPDIITFGKGVSAGYAPLAGMIVSDKIVEGIMENSNGRFIHGYTYSGHPVTAAAGLEAMKIYEKQSVLENCKEAGAYLLRRLESLKKSTQLISDIRGIGLLIAIEIVRDNNSGVMFDPAVQAANRINEIAIELGAVFYPGSGGINGIHGEHLIISPPLNINNSEIDEILSILEKAIKIFENQLTKL